MGVILSLIFFISILLTYLTNLFITSQILPHVNNNKSSLVVHADIQLFPSIKVSFYNIEYKKDNKTIVKINQIDAHVSFLQLFHKKLYVSKLSISNGTINLYNIPAVTWNKHTKKAESEEDVQKKLEEIQKNPPIASQDESFFGLDKIELTNLTINYSASQTSQPIHLNTIKYDHSPSQQSEHGLTIAGSWWNEPINATLAVTLLPGNQRMKANVLFANNELRLTGQAIKNNVKLQTHLEIKNREILEKLISIPTMHLPSLVDALINVENNKLSISPIQIVFPTGVIQANISQSGISPFIIPITLPDDLLISLSGNTIYQECPLSNIVKTLIKGINTRIILTIPESSIEKNGQVKKELINIDGLGIQFEGNIIPNELKKNLQTCFDYKLPDESSDTTYSIN